MTGVPREERAVLLVPGKRLLRVGAPAGGLSTERGRQAAGLHV
ncbi:MAG: hypothetical protein OEM24_10750 [Paracoccaceae bacterium]|nr:hypothetical protein [Paracoccaceae bacterium]